MRIFRRLLTISLVLALASQVLHAQFTSDGSEPGSIKWKSIKTEDFQVIFPKGMDSLARVYAVSLEQVKVPVSGTIGIEPNARYKKPIPVILHPYSCASNGMVTWTPHRMELITTPDVSAPTPQPWLEQLTVHESRHVAQMQYVAAKNFWPFKILTGELYAGLLSGLYCGPHFFEGDAVATETALSDDGRGRTADFLEYWRTSFAEGQMRNFWQWRYGLSNQYNPDYYTTGYVTVAGMSSLYGAPDFTGRYYNKITHGTFLHFFPFNKTVKAVSGKRFRNAFAEISDSLATRWKADTDARAPFMEMNQITPDSRLYTAYTDNCVLNGKIYSLRKGIADAAELYVTDAKGTRRICAFSGDALKPDQANGRIWWTETIRDPRWEQRSWSEVRYLGEDEKRHTLKSRTRWWNPVPSPDGRLLAVTEQPVQGGTSVLFVSPVDGAEIMRFIAPDDLEVVESVWVGDELFASAINLDGIGIFRVSDWSPVLPAAHAGIKQLFSKDGKIMFVSDLTGVNELYSLEPATGVATRLTSTPLGASEFQYSGDSLIYSAPTLSGRYIYSTPLADLPAPVAVDFSAGRTNWLSDSLSAKAPVIDRKQDVKISDPAPYHKFPNAIKLHSWIPLFYDFDSISEISFESLYQDTGLGATMFFQSMLGTFSGQMGWHTMPGDEWHNSLNVKLSYRALYPVFEFEGMISDESPKRYSVNHGTSVSGRYFINVTSEALELPYISGELKAYVPLVYTYGGWRRGIIPQARIALSDNYFTYRENWPLTKVTTSVRGYILRPVADSQIYPRWGIGCDLGYSGRIGISDVYSPDVYAYVYGYVPGILNTHGIRLSATVQRQLGNSIFNENYTSVSPRGIGGIGSYVAKFQNQAKFTAEYAFPFAPVGWSFLGPVAYIKNFEASAFADVSVLGGKNGNANLMTVGGSLCAHLGNFLWMPYGTRVGLDFGYNGGTSFADIAKTYSSTSRVYVSFLFDFDF